MRNATDEQLSEWGWKWAVRYKGRVMALSISAFDAERWEKEGIGDVVNLSAHTTSKAGKP